MKPETKEAIEGTAAVFLLIAFGIVLASMAGFIVLFVGRWVGAW